MHAVGLPRLQWPLVQRQKRTETLSRPCRVITLRGLTRGLLVKSAETARDSVRCAVKGGFGAQGTRCAELLGWTRRGVERRKRAECSTAYVHATASVSCGQCRAYTSLQVHIPTPCTRAIDRIHTRIRVSPVSPTTPLFHLGGRCARRSLVQPSHQPRASLHRQCPWRSNHLRTLATEGATETPAKVTFLSTDGSAQCLRKRGSTQVRRCVTETPLRICSPPAGCRQECGRSFTGAVSEAEKAAARAARAPTLGSRG